MGLIFSDYDVPLKTTQGGNAAISGRELENNVKDMFVSKGVDYTKDYPYPIHLYNVPGVVLLPQYPYTRYFGGMGYSDFLLVIHNRTFIRIECKQQNVAGTADNKLASVLADVKCYDENDAIVVLEGNGFNSKIIKWFKDECNAYTAKNIMVFNFLELFEWVNSEFIKIIYEAKVNESH